MRILLIQYKMLGDVLTSTIIAQQLKIAYPQAQVDYLITAPAVAIVAGNPFIAAMIPVQKQDMGTVGGIISLSRKLSKNRYDILLDAYGKNNSALLSLLTRAPKKIGYKKWFAPLVYTVSIKNKPNFNIDFKGTSLWSRLVLTKALGIIPDWDLRPKIFMSEDELRQGLQYLEFAGLTLETPITMIASLGSEDSKTLPAPTMAKLVEFIYQKTNSQILFNYMPSQKDKALAIFNLCDKQTQQHIFINHYWQDIRDFLKVLSHCNAIIGNEGGAINMAKAIGIPTFSVYSPWIVKNAWNAGEDGIRHIAVHLQEHIPELYKDVDHKNLKRESKALYKKLTASLIIPKLSKFLNGNYTF